MSLVKTLCHLGELPNSCYWHLAIGKMPKALPDSDDRRFMVDKNGNPLPTSQITKESLEKFKAAHLGEPFPDDVILLNKATFKALNAETENRLIVKPRAVGITEVGVRRELNAKMKALLANLK